MKKNKYYIALNHQLRFGKHKGKTCKEIIDLDPLYLKWVMINMPVIKFDGHVKEKLNLKLDKIKN
jgi:uncharacterized protein (DUF3820 family)